MDSNSDQAPGLGMSPPMEQGGPVQPTSSFSDPSAQIFAPAAAAPSQSVIANPQSSSVDGFDALEQEWIDRAKDIVEQTKSDPFTESKELAKVKAAYMQARYNKHINVPEDQS